MAPRFIQIGPEQIEDNPFKLIGGDWMLITAGTFNKCNTMTASWGGLGVLWDKHVVFCFIRPSRYTFEFVERHPVFTLSFFDASYRPVLEFCGSQSGRHVNKIERCGLTPVEAANGSVYFQEARLVLECRKLYYQDIDPNAFMAQTLNAIYPEKDYHRMYIGEIERVWLGVP
jgi:flavin reductase (DIM6/NTAB) family NADH-FMN oxidoreductase RutF